MNTNDYKNISKFIFSAKNLVLSTHTNPDGDTIGSTLGLYHFLKSKGIHCRIVSPDLSPDFLTWLPNYQDFVLYDQNPGEVERLIKKADVIVHVDYNAFHRTGDSVSKLFEVNPQTKHLIIDHHPNPADVFSAYASDVSACSTAQLVYEFTQFVAPGELLSKEAAMCLYVGLITDTGSFSYGMSDEKPYLMAADLVKAGIDDRLIHQNIYSNSKLDRLRLLGFALSEKLVVVDQWAYISLEKSELNKYNHQSGDTEGLVNYALSIEGVLAAVLLTEREDRIRLSFRSKGNFAINQVAQKYFEGGGHKNAAGGNSFVSMDQTIENLKKRMLEFDLEIKNAMLS